MPKMQYLLPTVTISVAYYQIFGQLSLRMQQKKNQLAANTASAANGTNANSSSNASANLQNNNNANNVIVERIENDIQRMKRTTHLLIWVGVMFCVCWLPLNTVNTVSVNVCKLMYMLIPNICSSGSASCSASAGCSLILSTL